MTDTSPSDRPSDRPTERLLDAPPQAPAALLDAALRSDPARPLVTFYDDASGERTELSVATFDNWVAKTANLLVDGFGLGPQSRVVLLLPLHWQTAVWLAACWRAGATAVLGDGETELAESSLLAGGADLAVCSTGTIGAALSADDVVALSLRPLGLSVQGELPAGVLDYAVEIPAYGDRFAGPAAAAAGARTEVDGKELDATALTTAAREAATRWGLAEGGRLMTSLAPDTPDGLLALLPAALATGGSVVLSRNPADAATLTARTATERVTATATPI